MRLFLTIVSCCLRLGAQSMDATISGAVTDPRGAPVPAATITVRQAGTGVVFKTPSNQSGVYLFGALPFGRYTLSAEKSGFRTTVVNDIEVDAGARLRIHLPLEIGVLTELVSVQGDEQTVTASAATVSKVIDARELLDLPVTSRDARSLVHLAAGVVNGNFSGTRTDALNIQLDGINTQDPYVTTVAGADPYSMEHTSVDRVTEFRVITSPADAELGRGAAHVQMVTRSGSNEFHGSLWDFFRNSALNANTWFNNQRGAPRNKQHGNAFGARLGGPVRRNHTFFHVIYEGSRAPNRITLNQVVFTESARQGIFRFFPGVPNANAAARVPVVDLAGNPVNSLGTLQSVNLFGRDPNRAGPDPTGTVGSLLRRTPLPNNFRFGDGLNTSGYTWAAPGRNNEDRTALRVDHYLSSRHRLTFNYTWQDFYLNLFPNSTLQPFPGAPGGDQERGDTLYSLTFTSNLSSRLLNEFRAGLPRSHLYTAPPYRPEDLPVSAGTRYLPILAGITNPLLNSDPNGFTRYNSQLFEKASYLRGSHAFKAGGEMRSISSNNFDLAGVTPRVNFGAGGVPVRGLDAIPGIGSNLNFAQTVLSTLSGSVASISQTLNSPGGPNPVFLPGESLQRTWRQNEYALFAQDDFHVRPNLTLTFGLRYEFYGVPFEAHGRTVAIRGGSSSIFGLSGTEFADLFQPGHLAGTLTQAELIGSGSPNPARQLYTDDWNNFAPAVGLAWSISRIGTLRMGYSIGYERTALTLVSNATNGVPGLRRNQGFLPPAYLDLRALPLPLGANAQPLETVPLTDRQQGVYAIDSGLRTPYIQSWNVSFSRTLPRRISLEARYVGTKGTRLVRSTDVNEVNIFENGILDAFRVTQAGGNAPLFDRLLRGLTPAGTSGSEALRTNGNYAMLLANNAPGNLAARLNGFPDFTGVRGGVLRNGGFPENWIVANPQFGSAILTGNFANSTYHALQLDVERRFVRRFMARGNYTWSRALGEGEGDAGDLRDDYRTVRNRSLDKRLLGFHRTHLVNGSFVWELPRGLQIGGLLRISSGPPLELAAANAFNTAAGTGNTPSAAAPIDKSLGAVSKSGIGVSYFRGLVQVVDPGVATLTSSDRVRALSTLRAIADGSGRILLVNPAPGTLGTLAPNFLEGPGSLLLDLNLIKRIRLDERRELQLNTTFENAPNHPQFGAPNTNMNSLNFGQIVSASGNRVIVIGLRLSF